MKRIGILLSLILASALLLAHPRRDEPQAAEPFFPVAVWYGGGKARAPMLEPVDATSPERWGKDLDSIKAVGFNTVKCWVDWATAEPSPGQFDFKNLDLLLKLAQARGLRVIVQIYTDSAPDWVGEKYPGGRFVDRSGAVIHSEGAPGYCIDDPDVRRAIVQFIEALSRDANRSPALYGWDVWSEPHVINWADFPYLLHPEFCYCQYSQARFREWLRGKYGTLAALNRAWYRKYKTWSQVQPPRASTILSYTDYLDWRAFIADKLAGDLKTRVTAVRSADPTHPITSHAAVPGLFTSPTDGFGEPDDWKMNANADFFGTSLYPKHSESVRPWSTEMLAAGLDFTRSAAHSFGKGFWIGELQAGQGVTGMRIAEPVTPHDEDLWMWDVIAHGAREIAIYAWCPMSSGYESGGYGLINLDGTLTPRAREAGRVARTIEKNAAGLLAAEPAPAQVAILYNRLSYMVGGTQSSLSKLGNAERDSLMGVYRAFFEDQIPADFVHPMDVTGHRLGQYKILFLPYPVMLSKEVAEGVKNYIRGGGTVVAEARLAWNDARGYAMPVIPGFGLDQVFGTREKIIRPVEKAEILPEASAGLAGLNGNEPAIGDGFEEDLEPLEGGRVLAKFRDGEPAIVEKDYGKGKAILVGSFIGLSYQRDHEEATKDLMLAMARAAGVAKEVKVEGQNVSEIEIRRLVSSHEQFLFVFNHSDQPANVEVSFQVSRPVREIRDIEQNRPVEFHETGGWATIHPKLDAGEIRVIRVKER
jgi:beta-galactosidase